LYPNPRAHDLVKSGQVAGGLRIKKDRARTTARDHIRHGMNTLFAAVYVLGETVIGVCQPSSLFFAKGPG
jgi:hypothetical protein